MDLACHTRSVVPRKAHPGDAAARRAYDGRVDGTIVPAGVEGVARSPASASQASRMHPDVQWLRVVGMLLVFAVHVAEPFNPWDAWHIQNAARSKWLGELALLLAPWIMPLFMVLAGESAWYALAKRSAGAYVRERLLRIGLPLVAGILILVPPQVWLERRLNGQFSGSLVAFYPHFFDGVYPQGNFSWHHLWFLVFLLVFSLLTLPVLEALRTHRGRRFMAVAALACEGRLGLVALVVPAIVVKVGVAAASGGFAPLAFDWSNRALLLPAFLAGFAYGGEPGFRRAVDRHWRAALAVALLVSAALAAWAWPGHVLGRLPPARSAGGVALWFGYASGAACWLVALLGVARRDHREGSVVLERASEMVYPFYVLHHPIVVAVAYVVVQWRIGAAPAFAAVASASLVATLALCTVVSAFGPLRILFGLRWHPRHAADAVPAPSAGPLAGALRTH